MTIYKMPYDTLVGRNILNVDKTIKELYKYIIDDNVLLNHAGLISNNLAIEPIGLMGNCHAALKMPFFSNPITVDVNKKKYAVMDFRPFTVPTGNGCLFSDVRIRSNTEYNLALDRLIFSLDWQIALDERRDSLNFFKNNFNFATMIFSKWINRLLTQRFNLYPNESLAVEIICNFYYQSLYESFDQYKNDENDHKFLIHTIKNTNAQESTVREIFNKLGKMNGVDDLCSNISTILENVKLEGLNSAVLITIVGNSWFGLNAKEMLAVALEYPPIFIPLVYNAAKEKTYKHTYLADVISHFAKAKDMREFLMNYKSLVDSYISNDHISSLNRA